MFEKLKAPEHKNSEHETLSWITPDTYRITLIQDLPLWSSPHYVKSCILLKQMALIWTSIIIITIFKKPQESSTPKENNTKYRTLNGIGPWKNQTNDQFADIHVGHSKSMVTRMPVSVQGLGPAAEFFFFPSWPCYHNYCHFVAYAGHCSDSLQLEAKCSFMTQPLGIWDLKQNRNRCRVVGM